MKEESRQKLVSGYKTLAHRVHELLEHSREKASDRLKNAVLKAEDELISLKELSRMEARQLGDWLKRDLAALTKLAAKTGDEVREWLPVEIGAEERFLADKLLSVADQTTLELLELKEAADLSAFEIWHTGEVTAPGILECTQCGKKIHLAKTAHIPPCPACHNTTFARIADDMPEA